MTFVIARSGKVHHQLIFSAGWDFVAVELAKRVANQ